MTNITRIKINNKNMVQDNKALVLDEDISIIGRNNEKYTVLGTKEINHGGEATLFFCKHEGSDEKLVAKIYHNYANVTDETEYLKLREEISEFLIDHSDVNKYHLLPVVDYAMIEIEIGGNVAKRYYVDIIPYCESGDLDNEKITYNDLKKEFIPAINTALTTLHENSYVHRDLKPANLFSFNNQLVIGDFGAMCRITNAGVRLTQVHIATYGYAAPETSDGLILPATDYYSFGMTLASLFKGEFLFSEYQESNAQEIVVEMRKIRQTKKLPLKFTGDEIKLENLIVGLLMFDFDQRCDKNGIESWLKTGNWKGQNQMDVLPSEGTFPRPFKAKEGAIYTYEELSEYMNNHWREARGHILDSQTIAPFFGGFDQSLKVDIDSIVSQHKKRKISDDVAIAQVLYLICPKTFYYKGLCFADFKAFLQYISENETAFRSECKAILKEKLISWWLKKYAKTNPNEANAYKALIEKIERAEELMDKHPHIGYCYFAAISSDNTLSIRKSVFHGENIDEIFAYHSDKLDFFRNFDNFYETRDMFTAFLLSVNVVKYTDVFNNTVYNEGEELFKMRDRRIAEYTGLFFVLNSCIKNRAFLNKTYVEKGPFSCYTWLQKNTSLYRETGNGNILAAFQKTVNTDKDFMDVILELIPIEAGVANIRRNIQMQLLNYKMRGNYVEAVSEDGKFVDNEYDLHITQGFLKTIR